jgi:Ca2+-transporting ATPase
MGERGTDVAREAAALVLLDDDFTLIVRAVRLGRRIFDNLRKAMSFLLAVRVLIAGLTVVPVLLGWPLILLPVHIVFLELIIDPVCWIVFESEPEEPDVMQRPPRRAAEPLFDRRTVVLSLQQGLGVLLVTFGVLAGRCSVVYRSRTHVCSPSPRLSSPTLG